MAEFAPITEAHDWFIGERKSFEFTVLDVTDISLWDVVWQLKPAAGSATIYITKTSQTGGGITKMGNKATVLIEPDDYGAIPGGGTFEHALMRVDADNDAVLAYGAAVLREAATP